MRRSLSGLVLGLALIVGSLSWASYVLTRTVMDPTRSEAFADQVIDNQRLRSALIGRLADGLAESVPFDAPVPRQALEGAAEDALDEPGIAAELKRALVLVHQNALNGVEEDVVLDASVLGLAARNQLVGDRPALEGRVPDAPSIEVQVPTSGLAFLGTVKSGVQTFTLYSAAGALLAGALALIVARDRPRILRRVAVWAFGTAAFWLAVGIGVPIAAEILAPASAAVVAAAIEVFFGSMIRPGIIMAAVGAGLLALSAIWPSVARRRPAKSINARPIQAPPVPILAANPGLARQGSNIRSHGAEYSRLVTPEPVVDQPLADQTTVMPAPSPSPFANPAYEPPVETKVQVTAPSDSEPTPQWKPGVGYIDAE